MRERVCGATRLWSVVNGRSKNCRAWSVTDDEACWCDIAFEERGVRAYLRKDRVKQTWLHQMRR